MQPVKKIIQEKHADLIKEAQTLTLIVDGGSLLYSSFSDTTLNSDGIAVGAIWQFLLQLRIQLTKRQFDKIFVTFDDTYSGYKRWQLMKYYKSNRDKHYQDYGESDYAKAYNANLKAMQKAIFSKNKTNNKPEKIKSDSEKFIDENFDRCRDRLCLYFNEMCIRWHMDEVVEGDDLIAYYCQHKKKNEKILIISTDMDLCQLLSDDVMIYNQVKKKYYSNKNFIEYFGYPSENVVIKKIFCGDTSDSISNIKGLSESGFFELMPEAKKRKVTIEEVKNRAQELIDKRISIKKKPYVLHENIINGISNKQYDGDFYEINKKIIDLSEPLMTDSAIEEMDGILDTPLDITDRSYKNLVKLVEEDKIPDLIGDTKFAVFFSPFKRIEEMEHNFYDKETKS